MGWAVGFDHNWSRDIGYGVPATCDHPSCGKKINRGLAHVCGAHPWGGENGCGLFFCSAHLGFAEDHGDPVCGRCQQEDGDVEPFEPTPDLPEWTTHKLTNESWAEWRAENPAWVAANQLSAQPATTSPGYDDGAAGGMNQ